jgi:hypothetical protein
MLELRKMMRREVPAAFAAGVLKKRTKMGMATKPPPIPNRPVITPIPSESVTRIGIGILRSDPGLIGLCNIDQAASKSTSARPEVIAFSGIRGARRAKVTFVVALKAEMVSASRTRTSPRDNFGTVPESAAVPTTTSAAVVA